jgi:hypothetical protein
MAAIVTGCSLSDLGATEETAVVVGGASDGGSFVGNPTPSSNSEVVGETEADGGDSTGLFDEDQDGQSDPDDELEPPSDGAFDEGPDLSTDPDIVYRPGTCFARNPAGGAAVEVRCDEPHDIEVYAIVDLPGGDGAPFQGLAPAIELCDQDFMRITGVGLGLATVYRRSVLRPSEDTWADGERDVTCYVAYPEPVSRSMVDVNPVRDFGLVSVYGLDLGDCFIDFDENETTFTPVSCDEPHDAEVFIDFEYPPGPYPGDAELDAQAEELCFGQTFEDFVGRDYQSSSIFSLRSRPNEDTWVLGDRTINCVLTDELVRTGSFAGTGL